MTLTLNEMSKPVAEAVQSVRAAKLILKPKNPFKPPVRFNQHKGDDEEECPEK